MAIHHDVAHWQVRDVRLHRGGRLVVPPEQAPFGRLLPYRRARGEHPRAGCASLVRARGWLADFGQRGLADLVLGLSAVTALREVTPTAALHYSGPEAALMRRCSVPVESTGDSWGPHVVRTSTAAPVRFRIDPAASPAWLDFRDRRRMEVHAALPMRHYLAVEQSLGVRLAKDENPAPLFLSSEWAELGHVVFVAMPGWPGLDAQVASSAAPYLTDFAAVARELVRSRDVSWRFTLITSSGAAVDPVFDGLPVDVVCGPNAADCVDLFASAELVIGADVGLTQLAALTSRADGSGPPVVGLYSRHSHTKWTTGSPRQHAVATRFAQMLALADRSAEPDDLVEATWGAAADLRTVPHALVADFAASCAGWR